MDSKQARRSRITLPYIAILVMAFGSIPSHAELFDSTYQGGSNHSTSITPSSTASRNIATCNTSLLDDKANNTYSTIFNFNTTCQNTTNKALADSWKGKSLIQRREVLAHQDHVLGRYL